MNPAIWQQFIDRFGVKRIGEFYGQTEGVAVGPNTHGRVGKCGFIFKVMPIFKKMGKIVKVDADNEPLRDQKGFCIECAPNEPGLYVMWFKMGVESYRTFRERFLEILQFTLLNFP